MALGIQGASDRVWHNAVLEKRGASNFDGAVLTLFKNYISARVLRLVMKVFIILQSFLEMPMMLQDIPQALTL